MDIRGPSSTFIGGNVEGFGAGSRGTGLESDELIRSHVHLLGMESIERVMCSQLPLASIPQSNDVNESDRLRTNHSRYYSHRQQEQRSPELRREYKETSFTEPAIPMV